MKITIAKAIEIQEFNIKEAKPKMPPDVEAAIRLSTAGLKAIQAYRNSTTDDDSLFELPGEQLV